MSVNDASKLSPVVGEMLFGPFPAEFGYRIGDRLFYALRIGVHTAPWEVRVQVIESDSDPDDQNGRINLGGHNPVGAWVHHNYYTDGEMLDIIRHGCDESYRRW